MGVLTRAWSVRLTLAGSVALHGAAIGAVSVLAPPPAAPPPFVRAPDAEFDVIVEEVTALPPAPQVRCVPVLPEAPPPPKSAVQSRVPRTTVVAKAPEAAAAAEPRAEHDAPSTAPAPVAAAPTTVQAPRAEGDLNARLDAYRRLVQARLARGASSPEIVAMVDHPATIVLQIVLAPDGSVRETSIVSGPADPTLRSAALRIEALAEPFPPLPPELHDGGPIALRLPLRFTVRPR